MYIRRLATAALLSILLGALPAMVYAQGKAPAKKSAAPAAKKDKAASKAKAAPAPKAAAPAEAGSKKESIWQIIQYGGVVGYIIIFLSFVALALICKNLVFLRQGVLVPAAAEKQIETLFNEKKLKEAMEYCEKNDSMLTRIITAGLSEIRAGYSEMQSAMQEVGEEESIRLHQQVGYLSLIAAIAPMLGLLGTVLGMIGAFNEIAQSQGLAKPADLAYNIQKALVTTCMGLIVAVPTLTAFAFLRNRVVRLVLEAGVVSSELTNRFKFMRVAPRAAQSNPKSAASAPQGGEKKPDESSP